MADDLNQPYIGYRSAGRRRPELNDRAASANAPLAALRGLASGVLGAPGDIESLVRMLPGLSEQTFLPTSEDIERRLPLRSVSETPVGRAATGAGQIGGGFYTGPGSPLRAIAGLRKFTDVFGSGELRMLQEAGAELPNSGWLTGEDIQRLHNMITPEGKRLKYDSMGRIVGGDEASGFAMGGLVQKYADGGLVGSNIYNSDAMQDPASAYRFADGGQAGDVRAYADGGLVANSPTADFDPDRIDAIVGDLNALNAG